MSLKFNDQYLDHILQKIRNKPSKQSHRAQLIEQKYINEQKKYSPRKTNYQLQAKNIELRKQFKKLQKILNAKLQIKHKVQSTDNQIQLLQQKLKNAFNVSQTLELSLTRMRGTEREKKKEIKNQQPHCCCRRYSKSKTEQFSVIHIQKKGKSKYKTAISTNDVPQSCKQSPVLVKTPYSPQKNKGLYTQSCTIQCSTGLTQKQKQTIEQKKQQIQRLKSLIQFQTKVIKQYESSIGVPTNIGKIAKSASLKLGNCLKTCASIGSIIKTKRNMQSHQQ